MSINTIRTTPRSDHLDEAEIYSREIASLINSSHIKRVPFILQLHLFLDANHLLRSNDRIHSAPLSEVTKFPFLLPPKHQLTSLIIHSVHLQLFHAGTNATLTAIRQKFWIPTARQQIKSQLHRCVISCKHSGKPYQKPDPPPLPQIQTCTSVPFMITGIDLLMLYTYVTTMLKKRSNFVCLRVP